MEIPKLNVLCFHWITHPFYNSEWKAVAILPETFTTKDIMALNNFRNQKPLDVAIAEKIVEHRYCAIYSGPHGKEWFNDEQTKKTYPIGEYMVDNPKSNGDLKLYNYLITGYADFIHPEKSVWRVDYETDEFETDHNNESY